MELKKDDVNRRWASLKNERSSWDSHWREIGEVLLPRSGRWALSDRNKGDKRHNKIYDSEGTRALRVLAAGMMAGMTSPARPWFRLATPDRDLMKHEPVKVWLHDVTSKMLAIFQRSNTYRALHSMYEELGAFGTAASIVTDDFDDVIRHYSLTIGEYAVQQDFRGQISTLYRELQLTVGQMVAQFGKAKCSATVRTLYDRGVLDQYVTVIHAIEPRSDRDPKKRDSKNMPWKSVYFEPSEQKPLRESGFQNFSALVPRWDAKGGDVYGHSPGMEALGDLQSLQHEQLRKAQGIDYMTRPPMQAPHSMKGRDVDLLPGGLSYYDAAAPTGGLRPAFESRMDLSHLLADIQDVRQRVRSCFYADLFLMIAGSDRTQMTATEVAERHEEKMLMLGPVLERLHNELLNPKIDITFEKIVRAGALPTPPPELEGQQIEVEFVSMLAQAQRAIGTNAVDRWVGNLGVVAQMKPDVLDRFDADVWAEEYADMLGVDPRMIVADDKVAIIRQSRAEMQAQQAQAEMQAQQAATARNAAAAGRDMSQAGEVMDMFSGY